jgi:hypothetical protein
VPTNAKLHAIKKALDYSPCDADPRIRSAMQKAAETHLRKLVETENASVKRRITKKR